MKNVGNWGLQQRKIQGVREQLMESEFEEIRKDFKSEVNCAEKTKRKKSLLKKKLSDLKLRVIWKILKK